MVKYKILVSSGGGTIGIAQLGAVQYLFDNNYLDLNTYIGTSIGALFSSLYAVGYMPIDIYDFIYDFDLHLFKNFNMNEAFNKYGVDDGKKLMNVFKQLIKKKIGDENITFGQLYKLKKIKLIICAVCLNDKKQHHFDHINSPNMPIHFATRMSIAIPFYYTAVEYKNKLFVDGSVIDQYPIEISKQLNKTIGIFTHTFKKHNKINNLEDYLMSLTQSFMKGTLSHQHIDKYTNNTIYIHVNMNMPMDFDLKKKDIKLLYNIGYEKANAKMKKNNIEHFNNNNNNYIYIIVLLIVLILIYIFKKN
jgi:NTE family protein